jgi:hypothetical protein
MRELAGPHGPMRADALMRAYALIEKWLDLYLMGALLPSVPLGVQCNSSHLSSKQHQGKPDIHLHGQPQAKGLLTLCFGLCKEAWNLKIARRAH